MNFGRVTCLSALIEAKAFQIGNQINQKAVKLVLESLIEIYKVSETLRE